MYNTDFELSRDFRYSSRDMQVLSEAFNQKAKTSYFNIKNLQSYFWQNKIEFSILKIKELSKKFFDLFQIAIPYILKATEIQNKILSISKNVLSLTKLDCLCLLSALFFCCSKRTHSFLHDQEKAKFLCMITYFEEMFKENERVLQNHFIFIGYNKINELDCDSWPYVKLSRVRIDITSKIEDCDDNYLKVDFANMHIGGGVLNHGCVQEEILFSIYPELLVSMFYCRRMKDNEAIFIKGAERFSCYKGYAWDFTFTGKYKKRQNPENNVFVAIDALMFDKSTKNFQYDEKFIMREIKKACAGFLHSDYYDQGNENRVVVTGKWGCGVFNGHPPLKFIIMWIAASLEKRDMIMCTLGKEFCDEIYNIYKNFEISTVGDLFQVLQMYSRYPNPIDRMIRHSETKLNEENYYWKTVQHPRHDRQRNEFNQYNKSYKTANCYDYQENIDTYDDKNERNANLYNTVGKNSKQIKQSPFNSKEHYQLQISKQNHLKNHQGNIFNEDARTYSQKVKAQEPTNQIGRRSDLSPQILKNSKKVPKNNCF